MDKLFEIEPLLRSKYKSPGYDNKEDPMDELIYILLSKRTNLKCNQISFNNLKTHIKKWDLIKDMDTDELKNIISVGGLLERKTNDLINLCEKIFLDFQTFDLRKVFLDKDWNDNRIYNYLVNLPGIGAKSAYCVMLYSLKLPVMPADVHVIRVFNRLGLIPYDEKQHQQAQKMISNIVRGLPWSFLYSLHVNLKAHGETVCKKSMCLVENCVISSFCDFFNK